MLTIIIKYNAIFFIILSFFYGQRIISQTDTLNKFNTNGKKTGYWKILLDEKVNPTKNISDSYFYCFELWDNGKRITPRARHKWKKNKLTIDKTIPYKGIPTLISGTFKWYDHKGRLICEEVYRSGNPLYFKSYRSKKSDTTEYIYEDIDFTKKYNGIPGTFYVEMHSLIRPESEKYWFRKGPKGWKPYKIEN
ncbi:MAG: hypothetical protein V4635_13070 [Bacteroidota bacterium]